MLENPYFRGVSAVKRFQQSTKNNLTNEDTENSINKGLIAFARSLAARKQQGQITNQSGILNNLAQAAPSALDGMQEYDNANDAALEKLQRQDKEQWNADMQANQFNLSHANALNSAANQDRNYERQLERDAVGDGHWDKTYGRQLERDAVDDEYKKNHLDILRNKANNPKADPVETERQKLELRDQFKTKGKTGDQILQNEAEDLGINQPKLTDLEKANKLYFPKLADTTRNRVQESTIAVGTALPMVDKVIGDLDILKNSKGWVGGAAGYTAPLKSKMANFSNDEDFKKEAAAYENYQLNLQKLILLQETEFTKNRIGPQMYDRLSPYFPNKGDSIEALETKLNSMRDVLNKAALSYNLSEKYNALITINDIDRLIKISSENKKNDENAIETLPDNDTEIPDENDPDWQRIKKEYGL